MEISPNYYYLNFLPKGNYYSQLVKDSSVLYIKKLLQNKLITIDRFNKVFLTVRGRAAINMGVKKYLQIEKFEKELKNSHTKEVKNFILLGVMSALLFVTALVLGYISWKVDFQ